MALLHLSPLLIILVGFSWQGVALCVASYALRMFGVTAGYHRYFSHRSFKTSRVGQFLLAFLAQTSLQKGVLWWASHHRYHHWHSDKPTDVHSPKQHGFWYAHIGWIMATDWEETDMERVRDMAQYPEIRWLDRFHMVPPVLYAVAIWALFGWHGLVWGFFVSTVLLWHGTFTINSLSHVFGKRVYATTDTSRNNWLLALITLGEGWHNNHHHFQRSTAQGWRWYEVDITYMVLKAFSWVGLVSSVTKPPQHVIEKTIAHMQGRVSELERELEAITARMSASLQSAREQLSTRMEETSDAFNEAVDQLQASLEERAHAFHETLEDLQSRMAESMAGTQEAFHDKLAQMSARRLELEAEMMDLQRRLSAALHDSLEPAHG